MKQLLQGLFTLLLLYGFSPLSHANFTPLSNFKDNTNNNPGELSASVYLAKATNKTAKRTTAKRTIVLLHGCTQNAEKLATDSGFLALAKAHQFNLLLPQQSNKNNINQCFNWYAKQDMSKDSGELLSLKNMIVSIKQQTQSEQVYVAGLSAGGAMASGLLSIYPELFTAGAIIAGIPYPCADTLTKAISCMRQGPSQSPQQLAQAVIAEHQKANINWPPLSIWTGLEDKIVNPKNSQAIAQQWLALNKLNSKAEVANFASHQQSTWKNQQGKALVQLIEMNGLDHGIMVNPKEDKGGVEGPFLLKSSIATAKTLIKFWNIN